LYITPAPYGSRSRVVPAVHKAAADAREQGAKDHATSDARARLQRRVAIAVVHWDNSVGELWADEHRIDWAQLAPELADVGVRHAGSGLTMEVEQHGNRDLAASCGGVVPRTRWNCGAPP
jgi:hypothetical protein